MGRGDEGHYQLCADHMLHSDHPRADSEPLAKLAIHRYLSAGRDYCRHLASSHAQPHDYKQILHGPECERKSPVNTVAGLC
jgi:hypothetical protein